jgi:2-dehydro-3-deoxygluconokinase
LWGSDHRAELVLPLIERCDLALAGDHELAEIFSQGDPRELARRCAGHGPREVVVRCQGKVGVFRKPEEWFEVEFETEETADPMGAGDAFNAGYIAARLGGKESPDAARFAIHCGRAVATCPGDTAGFPRGLPAVK